MMPRTHTRLGLFAIAGFVAACSLVRKTNDLGPPPPPNFDDEESDAGGGGGGDGAGGGGCPDCVLVEGAIVEPRAIAVSRDSIFYSEGPNGQKLGTIHKRSKAGSAPVAFITMETLIPWALTLDATERVVWLGQEGNFYSLTARCGPLQGCSVADTANGLIVTPSEGKLEEDDSAIDSVVADAFGVYWTSMPEGVAGAKGTVRFCATAGCTNQDAIVLSSIEDRPRGIAVDATHVYWVNEGDGRVRRVAKDPPGVGTPENVFVNLDKPQAIVLSASAIYVSVASDGGSIITMAKGAPAPGKTIVASKQSGIGGLAIDASGIFWTSFLPNGAIATCPLENCNDAPEILGRIASPFAIALDGDDVYFTTRTQPTGDVYQVSKTARVP